MKAVKIALTLLFMLLLLPMASQAGEELDTVGLKKAYDNSVNAEGKKIDDYALTDQDGVKFRLSDYFKDEKPLVISFIYTSCPHVCPGITAEFKKVIDDSRDRFGNKFNALTIGFDTEHDTPQKMREYGLKFVNDFNSIRFAAADADTIAKLTSQVGFYFKKKEDGSFDHIDMATVFRPDGTIYKQVYSLRTQSSVLGNRIDELITGKPPVDSSASIVDKIKFFCYKYDPYTGKYVIDYPIILSVFMQSLVIGLIIYFVWGKKIIGFFRRKARR
ncbi:MAG: SCO family protein [Deltaproteobacteria bacterium]|nr:SCO family protein [Deltaproteobacteria bacterium]